MTDYFTSVLSEAEGETAVVARASTKSTCSISVAICIGVIYQKKTEESVEETVYDELLSLLGPRKKRRLIPDHSVPLSDHDQPVVDQGGWSGAEGDSPEREVSDTETRTEGIKGKSRFSKTEYLFCYFQIISSTILTLRSLLKRSLLCSSHLQALHLCVLHWDWFVPEQVCQGQSCLFLPYPASPSLSVM